MAALSALLLTLAACASNDAGAPPARVTATASGFVLDGKPWWPAGLNAYQLATDWSINRGCGAQVDVDGFFGTLPPGSLTRFNAFRSLATNRLTNAIDLRAIDAVFAAAEKHHQLVIPVLAPQDGACGNDGFKQHEWYVDGWTHRQPHAAMSFQEWMRAAVDRWHNSPALAAWELVGEPETSECGDTECSLARRTCPDDAGEVLRAFMDTAGGQLREIDDRHLITVGLIGGGQCGSAGADYRSVADSPYVDVLQYHEYDGGAGLPERIAQAASAGKPLLLGEIGIKAGSCKMTSARAEEVEAVLDQHRKQGAAGALLWAYVPDPRAAECTYDIGPNDPVRRELEQHNTIG